MMSATPAGGAGTQFTCFTSTKVRILTRAGRATLVANSIGSISALQCALDCPQLFDGVCIVNPNFRELHSAEIPLPQLGITS